MRIQAGLSYFYVKSRKWRSILFTSWLTSTLPSSAPTCLHRVDRQGFQRHSFGSLEVQSRNAAEHPTNDGVLEIGIGLNRIFTPVSPNRRFRASSIGPGSPDWRAW